MVQDLTVSKVLICRPSPELICKPSPSQCDIERKTFLIKALIRGNVKQDVMNKL